MTTQPEAIKQSELLNQLVLNRDTMDELGRIEVLWMYAPSHRVLGFIAKSGFLGAKKSAFKLTQISALGANGVLTHSLPEETNAEKVNKLETVIHCEVWSDSGEKVGKIVDYVFNLKTGEISNYLFVSSGLGGVTGEIYQIASTQILSSGHKRVLVPDYAINSFEVYQAGIRQKLTKAGEFFRDEKTQVAQELETLKKRAQETTEQAKGRFRSLTEHFRERAQSLAQQARETAETFNEQLQEEAQILAEQARDRSQTLAQQMREQGQNLSEQVEDGIQTLTVQAREILDPDDEEDEREQMPRPVTEEDPEDFFDALFKEDEVAASGTSPVTWQPEEGRNRDVKDQEAGIGDGGLETRSQGTEEEDEPIDLWDTPSEASFEPISQPKTPKTSGFDSPWSEDEKTTPTQPSNSTGTSQPTKLPMIEDDDDEPWV